MRTIVHSAINEEDGVRADVHQISEHAFNVTLTDTDADMTLPTIRRFYCLPDAKRHADELVRRWSEHK